MTRFKHIISAIDTHCAGEPTRAILSGLPHIEGATMADKKAFLAGQLDHFRKLLISEPRGHADMYGAVFTSPVMSGAQFGVLFMDNGGYHVMCGHGIMCVATALIENGMVLLNSPSPAVRLIQ